MKPRQFIARASAKTIAKNGGKIPFSSISSPRKAVRKSNPIAKAKRDKRYKAHLSSAYWKALRLKVWNRIWSCTEWGQPHRCEACGRVLESISEMQLAHKTYARFGHELDTDVQGQCKQCNQTEAALRGKRIRRTA